MFRKNIIKRVNSDSGTIDTANITTNSVDSNYIGATMRETAGTLKLFSAENDSLTFSDIYTLETGGYIHIEEASTDISYDIIESTVSAARILRGFPDKLSLRSDQGESQEHFFSFGNNLNVRLERTTDTNIDVHINDSLLPTFSLTFAAVRTFSFNICNFGSGDDNQRLVYIRFKKGNGDLVAFELNETGNDPICYSEPY